MSDVREENVRKAVRDTYGRIARSGDRATGPSGGGAVKEAATSCCAPDDSGSGCCAPKAEWPTSEQLGYAREELDALPEGADLGLGCGNPGRFAGIRAGETVLDLGSGGGIDCFLARQAVGESGRVIGVDMTIDMVERARRAAKDAGAENVEFRLGEIEALPVADASVDVVISNCVVNLSPDKPRVLREVFRVLRPGGRVAISDIVALEELSDDVKRDLELHAACLAGAARVEKVEAMLKEAGFEQIRIQPTPIAVDDDRVRDKLASASVEAVRPGTAGGCCAG